jgi:hypothetical protein
MQWAQYVGNSPYEIVSLSLFSKISIQFCRSNTRALLAHLTLPALRMLENIYFSTTKRVHDYLKTFRFFQSSVSENGKFKYRKYWGTKFYLSSKQSHVKEKFPGMGENCARKKQFFPRFINILHRL